MPPKKSKDKGAAKKHQNPSTQDQEADSLESEENPFDNPNLPSQEHCTWLLNVIQIHAKKIANECIKVYEEKVNSQISQLKEDIESLRKDAVKIKTDITDITTSQGKVDRLQYESSQLRSQVRDMKTKVDAIEQEKYQNNLQIVGLPETKEDDVNQLIKLSKRKLGVKLKTSDIKQVTRLGKRRDKGPPRNTIVEFYEKATKQKVCEQKKKLTTQKDPMKNNYMNDHLTKHRQHLLYGARQLAKSKKIFGAWAQDGNILVKKEESGKIIQVFDHRDLMDIKDYNQEDKVDGNDQSSSSRTMDKSESISHLSDYDYEFDSDY